MEKLVVDFDAFYTESDVLEMEKKILAAIEWKTSIWTVNKWLLAYIHEIKRIIKVEEYVQLTDLLDTATLDIESLHFSHSVLAAACVSIVLSIDLILSGH